MPKIKGPLFSVSASGTIANALCFRATTRGAEAIHKPHPRTAASNAQATQRAFVRRAAQQWRAIDEPTKDEWRAYALATTRNPWIAFSTEYHAQKCLPGDLPLVPATT